MNKILQQINKLAGQIEKPVRLMEVCGTHTEAIAKAGIRQLMPGNIELVTGPGCPVCVTAQRDIDAAVELVIAGVPIFCYGDLLRVPGSKMTLDQARAEGAQIQEVYSTEEVPVDNKSVFFGIGFETTAPMTAAAIKRGVRVYSAHKFFPPAMLALASDPQIQIDGFINPGHVSAVIGLKPYKTIHKPQVIAGFTPEDVLLTIAMLLKQIVAGENRIQNEYFRLVEPNGNKPAQKLLNEVFEPAISEWRGLGQIPNSGMKIRSKFSKLDAKKIYIDILNKIPSPKEIKGCQCAEVIKGQIKPVECSLYKKPCSPDEPVGACMVSREGACRIDYENR